MGVFCQNPLEGAHRIFPEGSDGALEVLELPGCFCDEKAEFLHEASLCRGEPSSSRLFGRLRGSVTGGGIIDGAHL